MSFKIMDLMVDVMPARFAGEPGCPNSGGPTGGERDGCPNSGGPTATCPPEPGGGCPNSGGGTGKSPGGKRRAMSAAALPDLRRQLRETLSAQA